MISYQDVSLCLVNSNIFMKCMEFDFVTKTLRFSLRIYHLEANGHSEKAISSIAIPSKFDI